MSASTSILRAIVDELRRRGLDAERLLPEAGIDPAELENAAGAVSLDRYNAFLHSVAQASRHDRSFGLRVAEVTPETVHLVGHLLAACGSLREAFQLFTRYAPLVLQNARFTLHEEGQIASIAFSHPGVEPLFAPGEAEGFLTLIMRFGQRFAGHEAPLEVRFAHPRPAHTEEHERIFRCPLVWDAERSEIVFPRRILDARYVHGDEALRELMKERADRLLREREDEDGWLARIKEVVQQQLEAGESSLESAARRLGVSARVLQRKLGEHETSHSALLDEVQLERAKLALNDPNRSIKEIAVQLGFSEASAFHRAFRRWTGVTPRQYRANVSKK